MRIVVVSGGPSAASDARGPNAAAALAADTVVGEIAAGLNEMHAKVSGLKAGADLKSSRPRELAGAPAPGSANLKALFGCHRGMMARSAGWEKPALRPGVRQRRQDLL